MTKVKIFIYFFSVLSIPTYFFIRLISPIILVRLHKINAYRFGHFMPNIEIYLCEKKYFKKKYKNKLLIDLHFFEPSPNKEKKVCNLQAERMVKRTLTILPTWLIYPFYKSFEYFKFNHDHFVKNLSSNKDPYGLLDKYDCHFKFETNEIKKGQNFLKKYGLSSDSKFICLNVRDSFYLKKISLI